MSCIDSATVVILSVVAAIVSLELIAMLVLGLDGVALSASISALTGIALKRQDIYYKLRGNQYGRTKLTLRDCDRRSATSN